MSEIEEFRGFKYNGQFYDSKEEAEVAKAKSEFREWFLKELIPDDTEQECFARLVLDHMEKNFEKYISLLNKFY